MNKILVIEDDEGVRENLVELLKAENYYSVGVSNGEDGFLLAKQVLPDLVLCDILMPGLDGYATLVRFREDSQTENIPFIFLTARTERDDMRRGMELGADDYITKPFLRNDVLKSISTRLSKSKKNNNLYQKKAAELNDKVLRLFPEKLITNMEIILSISEKLMSDNEVLQPEDVYKLGKGINRGALGVFRVLNNYNLFYSIDDIYADPQKFKDIDEFITNSSRIIREISFAKVIQDDRLQDLIVDISEARLRIHEDHLEKIIDELLDNSIKFSSPGKLIEITGKVSNKGEHYLLVIKDNGIGIPASRLQNLTNPVVPWHDSIPMGNNGIGLILVKRYLDLYKGTLLIESEPKEFTKVTISIPVVK
jgi:two-component system, sensor histidine kinase and response regulator